MRIYLVIAIDKNGVMGNDLKLPWRLSDDLKEFKKLTSGWPLIMGSNTFKSLPGILPDREHCVISSTLEGNKDISVFTSIKECIDYLKESGTQKVFVIGGANIVHQFLDINMFDELVITHVDCSATGNVKLDLEKLDLDTWTEYDSIEFKKSDLRDLNKELEEVQEQKTSSVRAQKFVEATESRDKEHQLLKKIAQKNEYDFTIKSYIKKGKRFY